MYRGRLRGGGGGKKREGAKEERSKISGKAGSSTISHMEKFSPLFAPPTFERGGKGTPGCRFLAFSLRFFQLLSSTRGVVETMGQTKPIPNRRNPPRFSERRHRIELFLLLLLSPPPTNFRIVFEENFRRAKHALKISLSEASRGNEIYTPIKKRKKKEKSLADHIDVTSNGDERKRTTSQQLGRSCAKETRRRKRKMKGWMRKKGEGGGDKRDSGKRAERRSSSSTTSKFISGHPGGRNRRGQIPSRASPSSFAKPVRNLHPRRRPRLTPRSPPRWLGWLLPPSSPCIHPSTGGISHCG